MTSGLVLMDNVRWISFHSGYDFGYLLKLLTCQGTLMWTSSRLSVWLAAAFCSSIHPSDPVPTPAPLRTQRCPPTRPPSSTSSRPTSPPSTTSRSVHVHVHVHVSVHPLTRLDSPPDPTNQFLMTAAPGLHGGLQKVAEELSVARIGPMHQAGSDSLLTAQTFFKLCQLSSFQGGVPAVVADDKYRGELFGLGHNHTVYRGKGGQPQGGQGQPQGGPGQMARTGSMNLSQSNAVSGSRGGVGMSGSGAAQGAGAAADGDGGGVGGGGDES